MELMQIYIRVLKLLSPATSPTGPIPEKKGDIRTQIKPQRCKFGFCKPMLPLKGIKVSQKSCSIGTATTEPASHRDMLLKMYAEPGAKPRRPGKGSISLVQYIVFPLQSRARALNIQPRCTPGSNRQFITRRGQRIEQGIKLMISIAFTAYNFQIQIDLAARSQHNRAARTTVR
ncbi:MAG: hypothetical protein PHS63_00475 [Desulfoplanes sp.]|jgi:hypothetical protein|nr:hypothetical protein [Desulfoplanes sp.]